MYIVYCRLLTGMKIKTEADALAAMEALHQKGAKKVIISSTELGSDDTLIGLGSYANSKQFLRSLSNFYLR